MTDLELLRQYRQSNSQDAFAELARRHANWVYSAALRMVRDHHMAEEVAQAAFLVLARKAADIRGGSLTPWLFIVVRYCSSHALRAQRRRTQHEREAAMMAERTPPHPEADWSQIARLLDESVARLKAADRQTVLMRYYERKSVADIAAALEISEAAARKRLNRAVEKLRDRLGAKGIVIPAVALGALLTTETTHAAPAALLTGTAAASGSIAKGAITMMLTTKTKIAAMFIALALLVPTGIGAFLWAADNQPPDVPPPAMPAQPDAFAAPANSDVSVKLGSELTPEELAQVLGVTTWKLDVTLPPGATEVRGGLEVRHKSGKPKMLIGFWYPVKGDNPHRLVVALAPADQDKLRVMMMGFDGSTSDVIDNPFRSSTNGMTTVLKEPRVLPDGSFAVMGYFSHAHPIMLDASGNPQTSPPALNTDDMMQADIALDVKLTPITKPAAAPVIVEPAPPK